MQELFLTVMNWSEVWALFIPLSVLLYKTQQPRFLKPIIVYLILALVLNLAADLIDVLKHHLPSWLRINTPLYDIHSIIRFLCFSFFFWILPFTSSGWLKFLIPASWVFLLIINFSFLEKFANAAHLSGNLLAIEAFLLLIYCMHYYFSKLKMEEDSVSAGPDFWIVTGLAIYVVINFFVFLFYVPMIDQDLRLAINIWYLHNAAYILLCIFIAKAFYDNTRYQFTV